jgi:hypothetical protein
MPMISLIAYAPLAGPERRARRVWAAWRGAIIAIASPWRESVLPPRIDLLRGDDKTPNAVVRDREAADRTAQEGPSPGFRTERLTNHRAHPPLHREPHPSHNLLTV